MTLNNRTVAINRGWALRAVVASLLAGGVADLPGFLYPATFRGLEELIIIALFAIPSFIGAFFGRFWVPNLIAFIALALYAVEGGGWIGSALCAISGVFAAATMSFLAQQWNLVEGRARTRTS